MRLASSVDLESDFLSLLKSITYDGDKHVEQVDAHQERHRYEEDYKEYFHWVIEVWICVKFTE